MRQTLRIAVLYTVVTTVLFGLAYPLAVTGLAQTLFHAKANGQLIEQNGTLLGSRLIGQPFTGPTYFHSRPSADNYDATNSGGSNLGPTSQKLLDRIRTDPATQEHPDAEVPIDLITTSASGLDPDITPAAAEFQITRIARERHLSEAALRDLIATHTTPRQLGFLGEPRVNVLELNLDLDKKARP